MLTPVEKILFVLLALGSSYYAGTRLYDVYRTIMRGKPDARLGELSSAFGPESWMSYWRAAVTHRLLLSFCQHCHQWIFFHIRMILQRHPIVPSAATRRVLSWAKARACSF